MADTNNQGKSLQERIAEAEERRKNATISDIIAAKRAEADSIEASARGSFKVGEDLNGMPFTESDLESAFDLAETKRKEADRLEAAHRRERGDAAKLREALRKINNLCGIGVVEISSFEIGSICDAALAEPVRNCDVGTAEEQEVRFRNYCWNHSSRDKNMECQCPIDTEGKAGCKLTWAQMPYEGGAK